MNRVKIQIRTLPIELPRIVSFHTTMSPFTFLVLLGQARLIVESR
jgi:hypothetical protein